MLAKLFNGLLVVLFAACIIVLIYTMAKSNFWHWGFFSLIGLFLLGIVVSIKNIRGGWH